MDKHDIIIEAVERLKRSEHKTTAIKVELEAQLGRRNSGGNADCEECSGSGHWICDECNGDWEGGRCSNECDEGSINCDTCGGSNVVTIGGVEQECRTCEEDGYDYCEECSDSGYYSNCDYCDEGMVYCDYCDGTPAEPSEHNWGSVHVCHDWFMERLSHFGLAEERRDAHILGHGISTKWYPVAPLKYLEFYNDGSVDSEVTFTLSLENPRDVLLLPKFIEVFNELAEEIGNGKTTTGAGMHMALLNNTDCVYPATTSRAGDQQRFNNFRRSMTLLLPALYFLGSSDDISRGLSYRRPEVGRDTHRSAIDWRLGALEFRVFNTCYDTPEAILDNVVVMSNAMKYWSSRYRKHGLSKVCKQTRFGVDGSDKLERFYVTTEHLDLLDKGLRLLKPSYYTVAEVKAQRKFKTTRRTTNNLHKKIEQEAVTSYREYEKRFDWNLQVNRYRITADYLNDYFQRLPDDQRATADEALAMTEVIPKVEENLENRRKDKTPLEVFVDQKKRDFEQHNVGQFTLTEEG